ncbi:hypothetical protein HNP37_002617 [Flavobacterium nitrogenifigens]|uniref:Uncharacterized protein n=2 Tax=Flavobacterium TaxID=237 RepID=A0A7W7IYM3_9FLAO|nr:MULTISPECIES: hypothetical protein [Flavobacterium]MBB4802542.1 hypothetical protein [Flavobacterium nitrogenifigens]MBB6387500.1 hypothetical protein [Flavobacterium notoginsengisoli]
MKRLHIILIVTLGLFLMPMASFACGNLSKEVSCKKEANAAHHDDCSENSCHLKKGNHEGCGGKCGHRTCGCVSVCSGGIVFLTYPEFKNTSICLFSEKQTFYNSETSILSGFYSIWLIPKIS